MGIYNYRIMSDETKLGVELADKTIILIDKEQEGIALLFPKNKFKKFFLEQIKTRKRKYISFTFNVVECQAILKGFQTLLNKKGKKRGKSNVSQMSKMR